MKDFNWTDAACDELARLFASGLTGGQIAIKMGFPNRGPVVGKLSRLGLVRSDSERTKRRSNGGQISADRNRKAAKARPERKTRFIAPPPRPEIDDSPLATAGEHKGVTLLDLTNHICRWPVGEPGESSFFFCGSPGADLDERRPYCGGGHCRRFRTTTGEAWQ